MSKKGEQIRKLLERIEVFPPRVLEDFFSRITDSEVVVNRENRVIELFFTFDVEEKTLTREMLEACIRFGGSDRSRFVKLLIEGYDWDEFGVGAVVAAFASRGDYRVVLSERRVTIHSTDISEIYDQVPVIKRALSFVFRERAPVELHLCLEGKKPEKKPSSAVESPLGGKEGEYCCFKLEMKVDHGGNRKYKAGFTNLKEFHWLSIANKKGNEEWADELYGKLRINGWYRIGFSLNSNGRFADSLDGFLNGAEPLDRPDGLGKALGKDESEYGGVISAICTHTKNSAFDGLYEVGEIVEEAHRRGHGAVGLTDVGSVQSFAAFEKAVKKLGLKGLYGVEMEVIPDRVPVIAGGYADG